MKLLNHVSASLGAIGIITAAGALAAVQAGVSGLQPSHQQDSRPALRGDRQSEPGAPSRPRRASDDASSPRDQDRAIRTPPQWTGQQRQELERYISTWAGESQKAARDMMDKYGPPDEVTRSVIIWYNNGPWKRTIVYRAALEHEFPMPHKDVLEQVVDYGVPPDRFSDLARFDGSVIAFRTAGELRAMCDDEAMNFLALNVAHDLIRNERDVVGARRAFAEHAMNHKNGRPSTYTQGLIFEPSGDAKDPDHPVIRNKEIQQDRLQPQPRFSRPDRETRGTRSPHAPPQDRPNRRGEDPAQDQPAREPDSTARPPRR